MARREDGPGIVKSELLEQLRARVDAELSAATAAQRATQAGATHEESRAEDPKDTRGLEATYLARGLAERVVALQNASVYLKGLELRSFGSDDEIAVTALVTLQAGPPSPPRTCFIVPLTGGFRIGVAGVEVATLTPTSPLGRALLGKVEGDEVEIQTPEGGYTASIARVR